MTLDLGVPIRSEVPQWLHAALLVCCLVVQGRDCWDQGLGWWCGTMPSRNCSWVTWGRRNSSSVTGSGRRNPRSSLSGLGLQQWCKWSDMTIPWCWDAYQVVFGPTWWWDKGKQVGSGDVMKWGEHIPGGTFPQRMGRLLAQGGRMMDNPEGSSNKSEIWVVVTWKNGIFHHSVCSSECVSRGKCRKPWKNDMRGNWRWVFLCP